MEHWKIQRNAALHGIMKNSHLKQIAVWTNKTTDKLVKRLLKEHSFEKFEIAIDPELSKVSILSNHRYGKIQTLITLFYFALISRLRLM